MEALARNSLRIVHVEDYDDFAFTRALRLKRAGFTQPIVRCHDGILALHYFSMIEPQHAPHVLLLDLHLPNRSGLEVLHWLRHDHDANDVAVYLLTASDDPDDTLQAAPAAGDYAIKTTLFDKLIHKLDELIAETNRHLPSGAGTRHDAQTDLFLPAFGDHSLAPAG
jgi:DNA-binding response OmpR family regulator